VAHLDRRQQLAVLDLAAQSTCGRPAVTRCCVFRTSVAADGRCRVVRREACGVRAATSRGLDLGEGSCGDVRCRR
jgi:hypothetical protein